MVLFILDNLFKTRYPVMEFHKANFISMKVNGKMGKCMEMGSALGQMPKVK